MSKEREPPKPATSPEGTGDATTELQRAQVESNNRLARALEALAQPQPQNAKANLFGGVGENVTQMREEAFAARPLTPITYWACQETSSLTLVIWKCAKAHNPQKGWTLLAPDREPWGDPTLTAAIHFHPTAEERIRNEVRAKLPQRDQDALRAVDAGTFDESRSHLSYEKVRQLRDGLTRELKQKIATELTLPALRLAGLSLAQAKQRCRFFVQILPDQPIPDLYWRALEDGGTAAEVPIVEPPVVEVEPEGMTRDERERMAGVGAAGVGM